NGVATVGSGTVAIDGGAGTDTVTYSGTSANDSIGVANDGTAVSTFALGTGSMPQTTSAVENLAVQGLGGDDTITAGNGFGGLTRAMLDGGDGGERDTG